MFRLAASGLLLVFSVASMVEAQSSIFSGSVLAMAKVTEDGKLIVTQNYVVNVPETRSRTESYTVKVVTPDGPKTETRTREVPYTVMVPMSRTRANEVAEYKVELKSGKKIEKETFVEKMKMLTKPKAVLLLSEKQRISPAEASLLSGSVVVIRSKAAPTYSAGSPYASPVAAPVATRADDLFDEPEDSGDDSGSSDSDDADLFR